MKAKRFFSLVIVCMLFVGCFIIPAGADEVCETTSQAIIRATGGIEESISKKTIMTFGEVSLDIGETVSYDCTYTPSDASIKFGFIAPDGLFYGLYGSDGSIDKTIRVSQRGSYTLAIKNYSNVTVTVTGTVNY